MNDNSKNFILGSLVNIWTGVGSIWLTLVITNSQVDKKIISALGTSTLLILITIIILFFWFLGSESFFKKVAVFVKQNIKRALASSILIVGSYFLIVTPFYLTIMQRLLLFLVILFIFQRIDLKIKPFFNLGFLKSFFRDNLQVIEGWEAIHQEGVEQGTDYREIPLNSKRIKKIVFSVYPQTPFFRAGFKLTTINGEPFPLRNPHSFLFHIGREINSNMYDIWAYENGNPVEVIDNDVQVSRIFNMHSPIIIKLEVTRNNILKCYVNDQLRYDSRINPDNLKRAFLLGWSDGHNDVRVGFDSIGFSTK